MAGSWKYEGDWADKADEEGDEQAFDQAPTPEDLEAEPDDEGEEADPNCEGIITDDPPEHWGPEFAPVRGRSRIEFPEPRSDGPAEEGEPYLAKPRSFMNRPTTAWNGERKARKLVKPDEVRVGFSPQERLLILDAWQRSGLPAGDFAPLVGLSKHTLYLWKKRFTEQGPAGLMENPRGARPGSKLSEVTKRTIVMLKQAHPDWGCQRISDELLRGPALAASASAVARVLHESGYIMEERRTEPHPDKVRRFERARSNQLWQTDLFTFVMKRQNRRLFLVAFMDDHSRYLVGYGLHASASTALVLEVIRAAIANYGPPEEVLTDNGPQYVTWRGKSQFSREMEQQGIKQIVARPRHPQTLGKIERFWGTLWRECLQRAVFLDLDDARKRIGLFIDHYNFQRPHRGCDGLAPADRYFQAAPTVLKTLKERVAANALELARQGTPRTPFYVTGQVAGQPFSVHAEGERVFMTRAGQPRQEVELVRPEPTSEAPAEAKLPEPICPHGAPEGGEVPPPPAPGVSWHESTEASSGGGI